MKMNKLIATILGVTFFAGASAFAEEPSVPQGEVGAVKEQVMQDKAVVKSDRKQLHAERTKLKQDRSKVGRKGRKHKKEKQTVAPVQPAQTPAQ